MIAIVTDSTCYLTRAEATALGVHIIPMTYTAEGRVLHEHFLDTNGSFQKVVTSFRCTTSQPSVAAFASVFEELVRGGHQVLCPVISSRLSGAYNGALLASKEIDRENIRIVDSRSAACGLRFLVERACSLAAEGHGLEEIASTLEKDREKISIVFSVENMDPLRRSGRLGFIRQSIGTILNMRPILKCSEGTIISHDFAKGKNQRAAKLLANVPEDAKMICVQHLECEASAQSLVAVLRDKFPGVPITESQLGPVIAIHLGIPTIGVGWMT